MSSQNNLNSILGNHTVGDYMTTNILVGKEEFPLSHITRLFNELKIHHLPIVDDENQVIGIISANDLLRTFSMVMEMGDIAVSEDLADDSGIADFITRNPACCNPDDSILTAVRAFSDGKFHALPVVSNGKLVGIFTAKDLIRFLSGICETEEKETG